MGSRCVAFRVRSSNRIRLLLTRRGETFRWVTRYNTRRRHSYCRYLPPNTYENWLSRHECGSSGLGFVG